MQNEKWNQILAHDFDEHLTSYGFATRLADENYWTRNFTKKAILEYKKFMYLAANTDLMVSPSPIIDKVWHEHLMFSKSYKEFCDLLGKPIQHVPSTHNPEEFEKFRLAKQRTRELYTQTFGEQPDDIWNYESMYDTLNLPKAKINIRTFVNIGLLVFMALTVPAYHVLKPLYVRIDNPDFLFGYITLFIVAVILLEMWNQSKMRQILQQANKQSFIFDLQPLELVYLKTLRLYKVINAPVNTMVVRKKVSIGRDNKLHLNSKPTFNNLEEYEIGLALKKHQDGVSYPALLASLSKAPVFANIAKSMNALEKYIHKSRVFGVVFYTNFFVLGVVFLAGFTRMVTGITRDKPVQLLFFVLVAVVIVIGVCLYRLSHKMVMFTIPQWYKEVFIPNHADAQDWDWQYAMLGSAVLSPFFLPLDKTVGGNSGDSGPSSGSSCGSDSGGSGCGSSCGSSCGGCGGD